MHATIRYYLSEAGRKSQVIAGLPGTVQQTLTIPFDDPIFPAVVEIGKIDAEGNVVLDLTNHLTGTHEPSGPIYFDRAKTASELVSDWHTRRERRLANDAAKAAEYHAETLATITERKTSTSTTTVNRQHAAAVRYTVLSPAWPWPKDQAVIDSPEAVAFVEDLERQNSEAKAIAVAEADRLEAEALAQIETAKQAETERRVSLGLREGDDDFEIEDGALAQIPGGMWESHSRGKNWLATITADPKSAGGLAREFADKAKGELFYILPSLSAGQAVEFGADYYSGRGRKSAKRWYGYVVRIDAERIVLHECKDGKAAIREGAKFAAVAV